MIHRTPGLRAHRVQLNRRRIAAIAIAAALLATSCGSDDSDDAPATTVGDGTVTTVPSGEGGVPLEPGSNLPPSDSETSPSDTTVGSELLAPADSLVGAGGD